MALLFCDGFEELVTAEIHTRWTSLSELDNISTRVDSGESRSGNNSMRLRNAPTIHFTKALPDVKDTIIVGYAVYYDTDTDDCYGMQLMNYANFQLTTLVNADGSISVRRGDINGTILGTSAAGLVLPNYWYYLELKATIGNSPNGSYELRVDGQPVTSGESLDTQQQSLGGVSRVKFMSNFEYTYYDDIYICDTLGGVNDDFLGPQRVDTLLPTASGEHTEWDPLSGENWANVADHIMDSDATYVTTMSGEVKDTYVFEDLAPLSVDNISGVQIFAVSKRTADTPETLDLMCRANSSDYSGEAKYLPIGYFGLSRVWDVNPDDSAQWEEADVNAAEFGIKKIDD